MEKLDLRKVHEVSKMRKVYEVLKRRLDTHSHSPRYELSFCVENGYLCIKRMFAKSYDYVRLYRGQRGDFTKGASYLKVKYNADNLFTQMPAAKGIKLLVKYVKDYNEDLFVGMVNPITIIHAGETVESLCIEHDLLTA